MFRILLRIHKSSDNVFSFHFWSRFPHEEVSVSQSLRVLSIIFTWFALTLLDCVDLDVFNQLFQYIFYSTITRTFVPVAKPSYRTCNLFIYFADLWHGALLINYTPFFIQHMCSQQPPEGNRLGSSECVIGTYLTSVISLVEYSRGQPKPAYLLNWFWCWQKCPNRSETAEMNFFKIKGKIGTSRSPKKHYFHFLTSKIWRYPLTIR